MMGFSANTSWPKRSTRALSGRRRGPGRRRRGPDRRVRGFAPLVWAGALALALGGCAAAGRGQDDASKESPAPKHRPAAATSGGLSLAQQVGQSLILSFDGPAVPAYVIRALRERRVAGVILFSDNVVSPDQLRSVTSTLQRAARGSALIMTDQEGGPVKTVPFAGPSAGQATQGTAQEAHAQAEGAARDLARLGINVNLAPVADVPSVAGAALAGRAFTGDAATVAARVRAAVRGYGAHRVGATAKHFPGLGATTVNTDDASATIAGLPAGDLEPFRAAVAAGVPLVMASHARYVSLDPGHIASQSPTILNALLRGKLGFGGVVVTDSMEAAAVIDHAKITQASARALVAGADLLLLTGNGSFRPVSRHLLAVARRSPPARARLAQANSRVIALKRRLGLADPRVRPGRR